MKDYIELFLLKMLKCFVRKKTPTHGLISSFSIKTGERFSSATTNIQFLDKIELNPVICQL